jgi:hypothetical protein
MSVLSAADALRLEILKNALVAVTEEQAIALQLTLRRGVIIPALFWMQKLAV